jgi:putative tryptophan/tyrosine transport system substrate-binding protein
MMKRRDFITLLGGTAAAWPLAVRAQPAMVPVGILQAGPAGSLAQYSAQLRKGLSEMGFSEGRNLALEYRYAQNQLERLPELAADLIRHQVAVIVTLGSDAVVAAAKAATTATPIVFEMGGDPVEAEFVTSLARPGGNLTGVTSMNAELSAKRLGLLHDLLPQARRVATILNTSPTSELIVKVLQAAASDIGVEIELAHASTSQEIDTAFASLEQARTDALVVSAGPPFGDHIGQIATLAARHALPAIYPWREAAEIGGLMSYSTSMDRVRQVGIYVGRILKGERPADLPVILPSKFEFVINLQTARALGIDVPPTLLSIADDVIE